MIPQSEIIAAIARQVRVPGRPAGDVPPGATMEALRIDSLELARILLAAREELGLRLDFVALAELDLAQCTLETLSRVFRDGR